MLDWFDYHGHMCIAFEMLGLSVFDFLVSLESWMTPWFVFVYEKSKLLITRLAEGQQLPAVPVGASEAHWLPAVLRRPVLA